MRTPIPLERLAILLDLKIQKRKPMAKRELIDTEKAKLYVRRDDAGKFKEGDEVGKSLAADKRRKAKTIVKKGQGDRGDQKPAR